MAAEAHAAGGRATLRCNHSKRGGNQPLRETTSGQWPLARKQTTGTGTSAVETPMSIAYRRQETVATPHESPTQAAPCSLRCGGYAKWAMLLPLACFFLFVWEAVAAASAPTPLQRFVSFATDFPPVNRVVLEWTPNAYAVPTLYQFRYQSSAFLATTGTTLADFDATLSVAQAAAGHWDGKYWYLEPQGAGRPSHLHTCEPDPGDWSNAQAGNAQFMSVYSWFTTCGISERGPGSVVVGQDTPLELVMDPAQNPYRAVTRDRGALPPTTRHPVGLTLSNDVPVAASLQRLSANGVLLELKIAYGYDTNIAPLGIPTDISMGPVRCRVLQLELGNPEEPLPRGLFLPDAILTNPTVTHLLHSNRHGYFVRQGELIPMDDPEEALTAIRGGRPKDRKYYLLAILIFSLALAPILVALGRKHQQTLSA